MNFIDAARLCATPRRQNAALSIRPAAEADAFAKAERFSARWSPPITLFGAAARTNLSCAISDLRHQHHAICEAWRWTGPGVDSISPRLLGGLGIFRADADKLVPHDRGRLRRRFRTT